MSARWNVTAVRRQFPGLARQVGGQPAVFLDGPAGSQVPQRVIDAVGRYLADTNANHGGMFVTSRESSVVVQQAHQAMADFLGSADPELVAFGANMTTLTFAFSRAMAHDWKPGDEVIVTQMEHDANYTPWILAARDAGATVRIVRIHPEDCTLDMEDMKDKLSSRTRLVALCCSTNAAGTISPFREVTEMAHEVGAEVYLDAVHYAPHARIDVDAWGCDYLVCSAYKFFGPHVGVLWGKRESMSRLPAYKIRPAPDTLPGRWMTGTPNHEGIAGVLAAIDYLADLGRVVAPGASHRRAALTAAYEAIGAYEHGLVVRLIEGLGRLPDVRIRGITDPRRFKERLPTVTFTHARHRPVEIASYLAEQGIFVWHGNYYAVPVAEALGVGPDGMVRIGLLHYNTADEVDRLLAALARLSE